MDVSLPYGSVASPPPCWGGRHEASSRVAAALSPRPAPAGGNNASRGSPSLPLVVRCPAGRCKRQSQNEGLYFFHYRVEVFAMKDENAEREANRTRKHRITLRLSDEEMAKFMAGVASSGLCQTEYLRRRAVMTPIVAKGYIEFRNEVRRIGGLTKYLAGQPVNAEIRKELNSMRDVLAAIHETLLRTAAPVSEVEST